MNTQTSGEVPKNNELTNPMTDVNKPEHKRVQTILVDDHAIFLEGLTAVLRRASRLRIDIVASFARAGQALEWLNDHSVDLLILDLVLPDAEGSSVIRRLRRSAQPHLCIIVLTASGDPSHAQSVREAGANAYLLKTDAPDLLVRVIEDALNGAPWTSSIAPPTNGSLDTTPWQDFIRKYGLTKREVEVLTLIAEGLPNRAIASRLFISNQTVGVHRKHILKKLEVPNTAALVRLAIENQLV